MTSPKRTNCFVPGNMSEDVMKQWGDRDEQEEESWRETRDWLLLPCYSLFRFNCRGSHDRFTDSSALHSHASSSGQKRFFVVHYTIRIRQGRERSPKQIWWDGIWKGRRRRCTSLSCTSFPNTWVTWRTYFCFHSLFLLLNRRKRDFGQAIAIAWTAITGIYHCISSAQYIFSFLIECKQVSPITCLRPTDQFWLPPAF